MSTPFTISAATSRAAITVALDFSVWKYIRKVGYYVVMACSTLEVFHAAKGTATLKDYLQ